MSQDLEAMMPAQADPTRLIRVFGQDAVSDDLQARLSPHVNPQDCCLVGIGSSAYLALQAARDATARTVRVILDEPGPIGSEQLSKIAESEAARRSDILILCRTSASEASQAFARDFKTALPHATLLFLYSSVTSDSNQRLNSYWTAVCDFLRWGPGFVIKR